MELWELIRRLLASANGRGQMFEPDLISGLYYRQLCAEGRQVDQTYPEVLELSELLTADMQDIGLLTPITGKSVSRTAFGDELLDALSGRNMASAFEGMHVALDASDIRRALHQLNS
jgi:hypothetical protein